MHQIEHLELDVHNGEVSCSFRHPNVINIAARFTNNFSNFGQGSGCVEGCYADSRRKTLRMLGIHVPGRVDPVSLLVFF